LPSVEMFCSGAASGLEIAILRVQPTASRKHHFWASTKPAR
jgi:hypothetical protein